MIGNAAAAPKSLWIVTDGKAGDLQPARAIARALEKETGTEIACTEKILKPRLFWRVLAPWGGPDPDESPRNPRGLLGVPHPDIVMATGRRCVPALRAFTALKAPRPLTVFLKDPRTGPATADLIWTPEHDRLSGDSVLTTLTAPVLADAAALIRHAETASEALKALPGPRLAVVLGGPAGRTRFESGDIEAVAGAFRTALEGFGSAIITASRRTPSALSGALRRDAQRSGKPFVFYGGEGANPYPAMLGLASAIIVTGDSHNMVSEAVASAVPVAVIRPAILIPKITRFLDALEATGRLCRPQALLEPAPVTPIDSTPTIARAILAAYGRHIERAKTP